MSKPWGTRRRGSTPERRYGNAPLRLHISLPLLPFLRNFPHDFIRLVGVDKKHLDRAVAADLHPQAGLNRGELNVWLSRLGGLDDADDNLGDAGRLFGSAHSGDRSLDDGGMAARQFGALQKTFRRVVGHGNPPALPFYGSRGGRACSESRSPTGIATIEPCLHDNMPALDPRLQMFLSPHSPNERAHSLRLAASAACRRIRASFPDSPSAP